MHESGESPSSAVNAPALCPLCRAPGRLVCSVAEYPVHLCAACHLEFLSPQPDDVALGSIYNESYFLHGQIPEAEERMSEMKRATASRYMDIIERILPGRGRRLLEIGCGHGDMLVEANKRGYVVAGVEFSTHAVDVANQRLAISAVCAGSIGTVKLPAEYFDVVAFVDVIEHVRD